MDSDDKLTLAAIALCAFALLVYQFSFVTYDGVGFMIPGIGGYFLQF